MTKTLKHVHCACLIVISSLLISSFVAADPLLSLQQNTYIYPLQDAYISSNFGMRTHPIKKLRRHHSGIDLAADSDAPIRAMTEGRVIYADPHGGYGKLVVIEHGNGLTSHYGHCNEVLVRPGQAVLAGQLIGRVGKTGTATGNHLHLEIRKDGKAQDPIKFFPALVKPAKG